MKERKFYVVSEEEIKRGMVTDVYFNRALQILSNKGLSNVKVSMEIVPHRISRGWNWGVLSGVEELVNLLEGLNVDLYTLDEGSIILPELPIAYIHGKYSDFGAFETSILGLLSQSSGVSTTAAHVKINALDKPVINFGIRRMHPGISLMIERASLIGGCDGSSGILLEELGFKPSGTMPHALILIFGDPVEAWKAYDETLPEEIPRIMLVDTFHDERYESLLAAKTLGKKLYAVRLDTPRSRRGNMAKIVKEVRWSLDLMGYKHVKIFVSGGLDDKKVLELSKAGVDAFGVGTFICNAETVDYGMDIVEVEGKPRSKRGKLPGVKEVYQCPSCLSYKVTSKRAKPPICDFCGVEMQPSLKKVLENGVVKVKPGSIREVREKVVKSLKRIKEMGEAPRLKFEV